MLINSLKFTQNIQQESLKYVEYANKVLIENYYSSKNIGFTSILYPSSIRWWTQQNKIAI